MKALEMAREASDQIRESERVIMEARNTIAREQSRINIALAKIDTYLALQTHGGMDT